MMSHSDKIGTILTKQTPYVILSGGLILFTLLFIKWGLVSALIWAILPFLIITLGYYFIHPEWALLTAFIVNYFIMGLTRYISGMPGGIVMDVCILFTLLILLFSKHNKATSWSEMNNPLLVLSGVWLVYCLVLALNPVGNISNWLAGIRGIAVYLFIFVFLTLALFNKYKYLKLFLFTWSILTLLAVSKALMQKYYGFDEMEKYWLYVVGGARTHIIYSGIRYFSFFTDAAAFGCSMGLSFTVFSIYALYCSKKFFRFYYFFVALAAGFGMMASGTRAAIFIIIAGYALFLLLSKQCRIIIPGLILGISVFVFFRFTYIGHGNIEIRRMRSAFYMDKDESYNVRFVNREKMKVFMKDHPFGVGIGSAKRTEEGDYMYDLPTDSSMVFIWVETGIIGLCIFLSIYIVTLLKGAYDVFYKIKNKELRGCLLALLAGISGMLVAGYGSEILQQFPNGPIIYAMMAFVMMGNQFDKELSQHETEV
jgi:hypothetical protein